MPKLNLKIQNYNAEKIIKEWFIFHFNEVMIKLGDEPKTDQDIADLEEFLHTAHSISLFMSGCLREIYCKTHKETDIDSIAFIKWLGLEEDFIDDYINYAKFLIDIRECDCDECKAEKVAEEIKPENLAN